MHPCSAWLRAPWGGFAPHPARGCPSLALRCARDFKRYARALQKAAPFARSPVAPSRVAAPACPGWLALSPLRGRCASAPPARARPPSGGPPARAPGAAVRPRRVPLRGARRICPGFGRRSSAPSAAQSARAGRARFARAPFSLRARGAAGARRSLSAALKRGFMLAPSRAVVLAFARTPPSRVPACCAAFAAPAYKAVASPPRLRRSGIHANRFRSRISSRTTQLVRKCV